MECRRDRSVGAWSTPRRAPNGYVGVDRRLHMLFGMKSRFDQCNSKAEVCAGAECRIAILIDHPIRARGTRISTDTASRLGLLVSMDVLGESCPYSYSCDSHPSTARVGAHKITQEHA
eukprot:scaffold136693_cov46-Prasinocladus_malaysianus.AAC.1